MKKTLLITALASVIGLTGIYQASAYMGMGHGNMGGNCGCNGQGMRMHHATDQMDDETKAKFDLFFKDTQDLRKSIVVKQAQKRALMKNENPDSQKVGELAGQLFDLRMSIRAKAEAAGLQGVMGMMGDCGKKDDSGFHHGRKGLMKGKAVNREHGQVAN